jgi:glycine oxidase
MSEAFNIRRSASGSLRIGIAGAGLLGRLLAWKLLQQGHCVSLFDRGSRVGELSAARVAASMLAP